MFLHNSEKYYPFEICRIITKDGEIVYDRNNRRCAFCYIDLRISDAVVTER